MTLYSFFMAVFWCDLFVVLCFAITKWNRFIRCSIIPMVVLMGASLFRLAFTFEVPETQIIRSNEIYPAVYEFFFDERIPAPSLPFSFNHANTLIFIWVVVSLTLLTLYIISYTETARAAKALSLNRDLRAEELLYNATGYSKSCKHIRVFRVPLLEGENNSPKIQGVFRPRILLPDYELSDVELEYILLHEWYHFCHQDILIKVLVNLICIIFWWNIPVYLLKHDLDHALEIKCDLDIIRYMDEPERLDYIQTGLHVQRLSRDSVKRIKTAPGSAYFLSSPDKLAIQRFDIIADYRRPGFIGNIVKYSFMAFVVALVLFSYSFVVQPYVGYFEGDIDPTVGNNLVLVLDGEYLVLNDDGTYSYYVNGVFVMGVKDTSDPYFSEIPIVENIEKDTEEGQ